MLGTAPCLIELKVILLNTSHVGSVCLFTIQHISDEEGVHVACARSDKEGIPSL